MPKKTSISRDSVFRNTRATPAPVQGKAVEPAAHQTAVWLGDEEIEWLDDRCQEVRRGGWRSITRSAFIRALIRAAMEREAHLSKEARKELLAGISGEAELAQRLA